MKLTWEKVNEILERIKKSSKVIRIVLFGSWAWGTPNDNSDIDVLVVEENYTDKHSEIVKLKSGLISSDYSIDILLFTRNEYEKKLKQGWSLLENIEKNGKIIYAA
jgi:predicted nucleotidyltransferase